MEKINLLLEKKCPEVWKFIKFSFTGAVTSILEVIVFLLLQNLVFKGLDNAQVVDNSLLAFLGITYKGYMYSYFISSTIGYTASFIMNRKLTFKSDTNPLFSAVMYTIMVVGTILFNTWFGSFLTGKAIEAGYSGIIIDTIIKVVVMTVPTLWTYPLQRFVIHRKKKETPSQIKLNLAGATQ